MTMRLWSLLAALVVALSSEIALACPVCAQRQDDGPLGKVALGVFIVAPWFVALAIGLWIRRGLLQEESERASLETNE
jgi:hypothetical protein